MQAVLTLVLFAVVAVIAYSVVAQYRAATGTTWQRLAAAFKGSATILWARVVAFAGAGAGVLGGTADWLGAPGVKDAIQEFLKPEYVPFYILLIALVTELARRRTIREGRAMWSFLASLLGGPVVNGLIAAYKAKLDATNTTERLAVDLAAKEIEAEIEARKQASAIIIAEQGRWWTSIIRPLAALPVVIYIWKVIVV